MNRTWRAVILVLMVAILVVTVATWWRLDGLVDQLPGTPAP